MAETNTSTTVHGSYGLDVIKKSLRDTIIETTIPSDKLAEVIAVIERYNVSTFLMDSTVEQVVNMLFKIHGGQDVVLDLITEFKYRLLINGVTDNDIPTIVSNTLSVVYNSTLLPQDYKASIARVSKENLNDTFICLIYLLRLNVTYMGRCVQSKIDKEELLNEKRK
jgi:hypothetical protein